MRVDDFVELQVQIPEVGADEIPVRLFALQMQFDEIDQDPLQMSDEGGGDGTKPTTSLALRRRLLVAFEVLICGSTLAGTSLLPRPPSITIGQAYLCDGIRRGPARSCG